MLIVLFTALVLVVVVQAFFLMKLARPAEPAAPASEAAAESIQMDLQPKAGTGQPPAAKTPKWNPPLPTFPPLGGFGYNPGLWDPFQEFRSMRQQMDQMFNDAFGRFQQNPDFESLWGATAFSPSMDIEEKNDNYVIRMDIPGADKANISVNINDRELEVSGKVDETVEEQGTNQLRKERRSGEFKRALTLPGPVRADEMEARYEKGVLTITVPKAEEGQSRSRRIQIK
jgi:HSP20 family protein